jgi:hypothetical protein
MIDWQPIETAPKDGTAVLLFGQWAGEIAGIDPGGPDIYVGRWSGRGDYEGFLWALEGTDAYAAWCKPSHWIPLPLPPAQCGEKP